MARLTDIMKEEDPCWKGYKQIGMKKKGSKEVPNCVPESVNEEESPEEILKGLNEMAMGNLERIEDYAEMISDRMEQGQQLESWMFSEITQALLQLNSVHNAMDGADGIKEAELPKAMIPGPIKAKLTQAIDKIKDTNLSYTQKLQVISKIIDSLGIDKKELTKISTRLKGTLESLNEITLASVVKKSDNFKEFVKQFYKEYKDFPKDRDTIKWLSGIYTDIKGGAKTQSISENSLSDLEKKLKSHDWWYAYSDDNRKYKSGEANWFEITKMIKGMKGNKEAEKLWNKYVPKDFNYSFKELSETQLDEGIFKIGIKHIIPLIPTGYAPNDPKYKMDLRILRNMLNSFYNERGYDKVILPTF